MKKIILAIATLMLASATLGAQARLGVMAGVTSSSTDLKSIDASSVNQYHAGVLMKIPVAFGVVVQPAVVYNMKGASLDQTISVGGADFTQTLDAKCGYLEVPVQVQWGVSLIKEAVRVYGFAEPFLGYGITNEIQDTYKALTSGSVDGQKIANNWDYMNKLEYGLSLGAGVEILDFLQVSAKYYWNYGSLYNGENMSAEDMLNTAKVSFVNSFKDKQSFNGITVSVAFLF